MWTRIIPYVVEVGVMAGMLYFFAALSWSKVALGAALTVVGAFFPTLSTGTPTADRRIDISAEVPANGNSPIAFRLKGPLRALVCVSGVALIIYALVSAYMDTNDYASEVDQARVAMKTLEESTDLSSEKRLEVLKGLRDNISRIEAAVGPSEEIELIGRYVDYQIVDIQTSNQLVEEVLEELKRTFEDTDKAEASRMNLQ